MFRSFKERRPWAAAMITFFLTPVIGMLYVNRGRVAIAYLGALIALIVFAIWQLPNYPSPSGLSLWSRVIEGVITIVAIVHVINLAKDHSPDEHLKWYARRWYVFGLVYLGFIASLLAVRAFIYQPFNVPSTSMVPSVNRGDFFLASKSAYRSVSPLRGDIIVFHAPALHADFIKRVVGLPGDQIQMKGGSLFIDGARVPTRRTSDFSEPCASEGVCHVAQYYEYLPHGRVGRILDRIPDAPTDNTGVFVVPQDAYFVLGDNRDNSADSRTTLGYVQRRDIIGRAVYKYIAAGHWTWQPIN
jgi:signal peptidase I